MNGETNSSSTRETELEYFVETLKRYLGMRESKHVAQAYEEILGIRPDYRLRSQQQYDLARLLEMGEEARLALVAYEKLLEHSPTFPAIASAYKAAGHLAYRLKLNRKARAYLEAFLATGPMAAEKADAEDILGRLPDGKGTPDFSDASTAHMVRRANTELPKPTDFPEEALHIESRAGSISTEVPMAPPAPEVAEEPSDAARADDPTPAPTAGSGGGDFDLYGETPPVRIDRNEALRRVMITPAPEGGRAGMTDDMINDDLGPEPGIADPPSSIKAIGILTENETRGETAEQRYYRLRGAQFAVLLPLDKRIRLEAVAQVIKRVEELTDEQAREAVIRRKGIVFDKLNLEELLRLYPFMRQHLDRFQVVAVDPALRPYERWDVKKCEILKPGLRIVTNRGEKKARWQDIHLITCGRLERQRTVDIYANHPCRHYRMRQTQFKFQSIEEAAREDTNETVRALLGLLKKFAPDSLRAHTVDNFLSGKNNKPQKFGSDAEFDLYNLWLVLATYAETIDLEEIAAQAKATSGW